MLATYQLYVTANYYASGNLFTVCLVIVGHAQVYLAITSNPVFCFGSEVVLVCRYPTVLEVYNKQYKYRTFLPNWECSCRKFILDANGTIAISLNSTAQKLQIPVKTEIFGDSPCSCECYLYLANRTKDKSDPVLLQPLSELTYITLCSTTSILLKIIIECALLHVVSCVHTCIVLIF